MAFQGIKQQGTDPLQLFLAIRQLRQQEEQTKQDQALARVKAMQEAQKFAQQTEKHRADMANAELTRLKNLSDIETGLAPQVDAAGVQTVTNIGDVLQQTGAGLTGEQVDAVFDVSEASAFAPVNTRAARAAMAAGVPAEEIISGAASQGSADRVERSREIGNKTAEEERARGKKSKDTIIAVNDYQSERRKVRKRIAEASRRGLDTTELREQEAVFTRMIESLGDNSLVDIKQIPGPEMVRQISALSSAESSIANVERLASDIKSGAIKVGAPGYIQWFASTGRQVLNDLAASGADPEMIGIVRSATQSPDGRVEVEFDDGKQLSLGIDQLSLAWDFVKAKRESARFTLLELQSLLKELNLTSPLKTRAGLLRTLQKIDAEARRSRRKAKATLNAFGVDPNTFDASLSVSPEDSAANAAIVEGLPAPPPVVPRQAESVQTPSGPILTPAEIKRLATEAANGSQ